MYERYLRNIAFRMGTLSSMGVSEDTAFYNLIVTNLVLLELRLLNVDLLFVSIFY